MLLPRLSGGRLPSPLRTSGRHLFYDALDLRNTGGHLLLRIMCVYHYCPTRCIFIVEAIGKKKHRDLTDRWFVRVEPSLQLAVESPYTGLPAQDASFAMCESNFLHAQESGFVQACIYYSCCLSRGTYLWWVKAREACGIQFASAEQTKHSRRLRVYISFSTVPSICTTIDSSRTPWEYQCTRWMYMDGVVWGLWRVFVVVVVSILHTMKTYISTSGQYCRR